jgi:DNA-binding CsgD family transcriptional regulator
MLQGRHHEARVLDRLLADARNGHGGALVLRGEAGIGKTSMLDYVERRSHDFRVLRVTGVESEAALEFAALQRLCGTLLERAERLPELQRDAVSVVLGLHPRGDTDRFLVGLAVLGVLSAAAGEQPLVCIVDDVDLLDQASLSTLAFVARRVSSKPLAMIFAGRTTRAADLAALSLLEIRGLAEEDARALLESEARGRLDPAVRDRIVAEARGRPDALLEELQARPSRLAGGFGAAEAADVPGSAAEELCDRMAPLPAATSRLLLLASAEPTGDPIVFWKAATELGLGPDAALPATAAGMLELGPRVLFERPLHRAAIYGSASRHEREAVHGALAAATNAGADPDRRAWHLAHATAGVEEAIAAALEDTAERARARGGPAAAAAFLARAATHSPDSTARARRTLAAARAMHLAGASEEANSLLAAAGAGTLGTSDRARADLLRARIQSAEAQPHGSGHSLLEVALRATSIDAALALSAYCDALLVALSRRGEDPLDVADAILAAADALQRDPLSAGLAHLIRADYVLAAPLLREAVDALRAEPPVDDDAPTRTWLAGYAAHAIGDATAWDALTLRHVELARADGAPAMLALALYSRVEVELAQGDVAAADGFAAEAEARLAITGSRLSAEASSVVDVWQRAEAPAASRDAGEPVASPRASLDAIEAAVRSGSSTAAADSFLRLSRLARASGTDWALGAEAVSRALLTCGPGAEQLYVEAVDRAESAGVPFFLARTRLLYGEWLRRSNRRVDARQQLRTAYEMLEELGAKGFAERARRELMATGATPRKRADHTRDDLTAQEEQIAKMAADGYTNPEIGTRLYLSPRTIEWHLRKIYPKLGVSSRRELRHALPQAS